jgi:hypothetical protein
VHKGQAVIWAANLLHGGSLQRDRSRTRHSQVTHYFFEGSRVFNPMTVKGEHVFWDYPEWVRDPVVEYSPQALHDAIAGAVPAGSAVAIAAPDKSAAQLEGLDASAVPLLEGDAGDGGAAAIEELERLRAGGTAYLVVPRERLHALEYEYPRLQSLLEERHRALVRDGGTCAIYALDEGGGASASAAGSSS